MQSELKNSSRTFQETINVVFDRRAMTIHFELRWKQCNLLENDRQTRRQRHTSVDATTPSRWLLYFEKLSIHYARNEIPWRKLQKKRLETVFHNAHIVQKLKQICNSTKFGSSVRLCKVSKRFSFIFACIETLLSCQFQTIWPQKYDLLDFQKLTSTHTSKKY